MIVHVYSSESHWERSPLVTREQLEIFFQTQQWQSSLLHPGDKLLLQDGYFEVREDFTLVEIFPTNTEIQKDNATRAVWVNLNG